MTKNKLNCDMILDVIDDMCCFVITDATGHYIYANKAWAELVNIDFELNKIRGRSVKEFIKDTKIDQALKEDRTISGHSTIVTHKGEARRVFSIYNPIHNEEGKVIAGAIIHKLDGEIGIPVGEIPPSIKENLMNLDYEWPGNVRELQNVIEWALNISYGEPMNWTHFSQYFSSKLTINRTGQTDLKNLDVMEKALIQRALSENKTKTDAAAALGISRTMLYKKIKKYNL